MGRGQGLAAAIGEAEDIRAACPALEAVEAMRADRAAIGELVGPVWMDLDGVVVGRQSDRRVDVAGKRGAGDAFGALPEQPRWLARERSVASEGELATGADP